jgi:hypothetical protein
MAEKEEKKRITNFIYSMIVRKIQGIASVGCPSPNDASCLNRCMMI